MFRLIRNSLQKQSFVGQCFTVATIVSIGDTAAQKIVEKKEKQDLKRTARFACFNFIVVGPTLRFWYFRLEKLFHAKSILTPLKKVALDQAMFAPFFIAVSIVCLELMKGNSPTIAASNLKKIYFDVLTNNYKIWPMAQLINFYFVPMNMRVLFACLVSILWNTYFTWKVESQRK